MIQTPDYPIYDWSIPFFLKLFDQCIFLINNPLTDPSIVFII